MHISCFSIRVALRDKLLRKLHIVTGPQYQSSATCNATFSTIPRQVAEKIAQCNRALKIRRRNYSAQHETIGFFLLVTGHYLWKGMAVRVLVGGGGRGKYIF